ncbi:transcriptional repressor [Epibacterium sp. SM1979]|uniref:Transcriptional repressor n=1 Tax=Tritonibacter litoralis TaxID=2662264 RepID=A0A843YFP2_9RHOB|nr:transcriptional repressor [Tritonibacter litoralis]MQQ09701.1 transcriptional repressor [Tritonibacter litoralis]
MGSISFEIHDHSVCTDKTMQEVDAYCETHKLQFTPIRRKVLTIMLEEHRAWGAYEILDRLRSEGQSAQPPVAYRALEFLVKHRFAHKIERLNAFIACTHPGQHHAPAFLICRSCEKVAEAHTEPSSGELGAAAEAIGFHIERTVIEAVGLCATCRDATTQ